MREAEPVLVRAIPAQHFGEPKHASWRMMIMEVAHDDHGGGAMSQGCSICRDERVREIDAALAEGVAYRKVAKRFGASESSVFRHGKERLPAAGECAREPADKPKPSIPQAVPERSTDIRLARMNSSDAVNYLVRIQQRTLAILENAIGAGRHETALKAIRESRENIGLISKLEGWHRDAGDTRTNTIDLHRFTLDELGSLREQA